MNNISPLRYPGGKTRARGKLYEIFQDEFGYENIKTMMSPFFGGGSFEFYLQKNTGCSIIANDIFEPLYNFWSEAKNNKLVLCTELRKYQSTSITKSDFIQLRSDILTTNTSSLLFYY